MSDQQPTSSRELITLVIPARNEAANISRLEEEILAVITKLPYDFEFIVIDNASELGGSIVMHNISSPRHYADLLLRELRRWH